MSDSKHQSFVEEPYSKHKYIGKCLLISNEHFHDAPLLERKGSCVDEKLLSKTFKTLGFHVQVKNNLSANKMTDTLRKVSKEDHTDYSCFVCVVLSHGAEGKILGSDDCYVPIKTLTSCLTCDLCPTLRGKPKIFFIQACRGGNYDPGVEADSVEALGEFLGMSDPPEVDFLCSYATVEGYFAWRNPETGSVFIRELCKLLMDRHLEMIQILTRVNHAVASNFQSFTTSQDTNRMKQMPCFISRLTKDFYIHPAGKKLKR
ncbi:hypothetical protein DNTS_004198 [Danionella cerebrum]|uniref:Caspase family p20 domain-containing protein n=1 Tax=Danionella cerebrum TaxID=2873325 RepID=A0A553Q918_9TELE|nr:hypothetical protein DNTS_004198 [Danionella translucida]